mmetsp:Transcript_26315/g.39859  ORF Transcript_26315/g.39859 Transcript_26315/m.39859 type:complete len:327 (+) Transcript_26315:354-1334(+)
MYLIHVGKCGGTTLGYALDMIPEEGQHNLSKDFDTRLVELQCRMKKTRNAQDDNTCRRHHQSDFKLSKQVITRMHLFNYRTAIMEWLLKTTNTFLFTVRDPVDRFTSAFYHHKRERDHTFYKECFPLDMNNFVHVLRLGYQYVNATHDRRKQIKCQKMGWSAIHGKRIMPTGAKHLFWNYQHYADATIAKRPNRTIAVIRTEHMWEDLLFLDTLVGGTGTNSKAGFQFTHHGIETNNKTGAAADLLTMPNRKYLCCILYKEMEIYQLLIQRAINLNESQKIQSSSDLLTSCSIPNYDSSMSLLKDPFSWKGYYNQTQKCNRLKEQQ